MKPRKHATMPPGSRSSWFVPRTYSHVTKTRRDAYYAIDHDEETRILNLSQSRIQWGIDNARLDPATKTVFEAWVAMFEEYKEWRKTEHFSGLPPIGLYVVLYILVNAPVSMERYEPWKAPMAVAMGQYDSVRGFETAPDRAPGKFNF